MAAGVRNEQSWAALKGIYLLMMWLDAELDSLAIGRLGAYRCAAGYYLYVGSAFGPGGLAARVAHHERPIKARPHWHIDYLRAYACLVETWLVGTAARIECCWASALADAPGLIIPIPGFGASHSPCVSHLLYAPRRPAPRTLTGTLLECLFDEGARSFSLEIKNYVDA